LPAAARPPLATSKDRRTRPSKTATKVAWIGITAIVVAALVTGLFVLFTTSDEAPRSDQSRLNQGRSSSTGDEFELIIRTVSFTASAGGEMVTVAGVVHGLGGGQAVYAVAQPVMATGSSASSSSVRPWFVGGPAKVREDGGWATHIEVKPTISALRVVAVNAATPTGDSRCVVPQVECITDSLAGGPGGPFVISQSSAIHATRTYS
jgi:hypothetical protein